MGAQRQRGRNIDGLSRRKENPERSFFGEETQEPRFLGFWVLATTILLLIFILAVYLAVYSKRAMNFDGGGVDGEVSEDLVPFSERVENIKGDGRATMIFRGKEFAKATGAMGGNFPLSNATFEIKKDSLGLRGRIKDSVIFWPMIFKVSCEVKEEKFSCLLPADNFANLVISGSNKEKIEKTFDENLNQPLAANNMIADEVKTADGYVEIKVIKETR